MTFWGYRRPDGRVGIRNKILILPASVCASDTTRIIASQVESAVTFNNQNGCSQVPSDQQFTMDVMAGYAANPNVYGTVVVSLGCENCQMDLVLDAIKERTNKPIRHFIIQENGGTISTVEKAVRAAKEMAQEASLLQKEEFDFSELIIGTECGGIRIGDYGPYKAVNYNRWDVCKAAVLLGKKENLPVYQFLKEPLIRKFGEEWYKELEAVAEELKKQHFI